MRLTLFGAVAARLLLLLVVGCCCCLVAVAGLAVFAVWRLLLVVRFPGLGGVIIEGLFAGIKMVGHDNHFPDSFWPLLAK
eukprot:1923207-Amphidinium_carterae.1